GIVGYAAWYAMVDLGARSDALATTNAKSVTHLVGAETALWRLRYGAAQSATATPDMRRRIAAEEPALVAIVSSNMRAYEAFVIREDVRDALGVWRETWTA